MTIVFYILAIITLVTAALTVLSRNPVHSAVYMIICFFSISGHMLMMNAQFLAVVNIVVYTGAIMILLLFTLMLMNLNKRHESRKKLLSRIAATIAACLLVVVLLASFVKSYPILKASKTVAQTTSYQSIKTIGQVLFSHYLFPFEFMSVLLIAAMIGVVLISKKEQKI